MLIDPDPASDTRDVLATDATIDRKEITHLRDDLASCISDIGASRPENERC